MSTLKREDCTYFGVTFKGDSLDKIDLVARTLGQGATREAALLAMTRRFAKANGVEVPKDFLIANPPTTTNPLCSPNFKNKERNVGILVPKDKNSGWFSDLRKKRPTHSENQLLRKIVEEYDTRLPVAF